MLLFGMSETTAEDKEMFGFRAEKPLATEIKEFATENEVSKTDAIKSLVRDGIEANRMKEDIKELRGEMKVMRKEMARMEAEQRESRGLLERLFGGK